LRDTNRVAQDHVYECSHCLGEHVFHKFGGLTFWKVFFLVQDIFPTSPSNSTL